MPRKPAIEIEDDGTITVHPGRLAGRIGIVLSAIALVAFLIAGLTNVGATERDVVFHRDGSLSILQPGKFQWVTPIINDVTTYDVRDTTYTESAIGISLDLQETTTEITVRYHPEEDAIQTIHQTLGRGYERKVLVPAVQGCVKDSVSFYNVEELTGATRAIVVESIRSCITSAMAKGHLVSTQITATDFDFSPQFNQAIEAKAIAQQKAQEEKNRLEQTIYQANQTRIQADAQAYATAALAAATSGDQGQAYLFLEWLKRWDGVLPQYMGGDNTGLLITPPGRVS